MPTKKYTEGDASILFEQLAPGLAYIATNFDLTQFRHCGLTIALEAVQGVESADANKKYQITLYYGKLFDLNTLMDEVAKAIFSFIDE